MRPVGVRNLSAKLGVASRQEPVARVVLDEGLPEVVRQTPPELPRSRP